MILKKIIVLTMLSIAVSGCAIWPYKKDFDCPIKPGLKCKTLYEINKMADEGRFGPDAIKEQPETNGKTKKLKGRGRDCCNAC